MDDSDLYNWMVIFSCGCLHSDVAHSSIRPGVHVDYSADSQFDPDSVAIGQGYDIVYLHIALFYVPLFPRC